ncbi:hypothetical protein [Aromatoleum evansii]|uniref:hypothetical protein n=1 Tax=Aromatoleum evansii TaxID=59406 RepID=UPI00145EB752|nr:hypothetical protein [Aromatoleum evansii]NMG29564.1 hypothetical protein [Aromatoleum evansii]
MNDVNTILVFEEHGKAQHRFCPEAEARAALESVQSAGRSATAIVTSSPDVALTYEIHPRIRDRVEAAKVGLRRDIRFHAALDASGVPDEPDLRRAVFAAFEQLQAA